MPLPSDRPAKGRDSLRVRAAIPLLGRERERATLEGLVQEGARLITITGPAGVGKTRFADDLSESLAASTGSQAIVARLEHATDRAGLDDAVLSAAARAGTQANGLSVIEVLSALGPTLLVLDPIDPLLASGALEAVGQWLDACPELTVLLVGLGRSHLAGERILELPVLDEASALQLFTQLAALHRPGFELKADADRDAAIAIIKSLDQLPLAIELAAPRLAVMTPQALLHRLKNRWEVLTKGAGAQRHGALEAAITWSLELLEPGPRALLEGATVFRGGFSIEVAEAVLEGSVIDGLLHLRERSLLAVEEPFPGEVRLRLLESVRLVAERGLDPARKQALEDKHALAYVHAAETWAREVELLGSAEARARLSLEHDNLAIVVERILGRGPVSTRAADRALRVLSALGSVLSREGASALLRAHLETAIQVAQGSGADPRLLARSLALRGVLRASSGRVKEGERDLGEALVLANHSGDRSIEARVLVASAGVAATEGQRSAARALLTRAKDIATASDDRTLLLQARVKEALLDVEDGAYPRARLTLEETLAHGRRADDRMLLAESERGLGRLDLYEGRAMSATAHLEGAVRSADILRDLGGGAVAHLLLGIALARQFGLENGVAEQHWERSLELSRRDGRARTAAESSVVLALYYAARGERGEARALLSEALASLPWLSADLATAGYLTLAHIEGSSEAHRAEAKKYAPTDPVLAQLVGRAPAPGPTLNLGALFSESLLGGESRPSTMPSDLPPSMRPPARKSVVRRSLRLDEEATYFAIDAGEAVDLSRRRPLRRLLAHLAKANGAAVPWDALLGVGWPGEKMRADAGAHRVRVAISTLRKMGLSGILETDEAGYRLKKDVDVTFEA